MPSEARLSLLRRPFVISWLLLYVALIARLSNHVSIHRGLLGFRKLVTSCLLCSSNHQCGISSRDDDSFFRPANGIGIACNRYADTPTSESSTQGVDDIAPSRRIAPIGMVKLW